MKILNYIIAVVLIILWVVGFFTHLAGFSVHFLLGGAFVLILINIIESDKGNTPDHI